MEAERNGESRWEEWERDADAALRIADLKTAVKEVLCGVGASVVDAMPPGSLKWSMDQRREAVKTALEQVGETLLGVARGLTVREMGK